MSDFKKLPTLPDTLKLPAEKDKEAIERFNKLLKDAHEREKLMTRRHLWRNANLPPFSIEPMPYERQRLADGGMTAEQRALRVQWVKDQVLAADEPRWIPELYPKNTFRRWISAPWDALFNKLYPLLGENVTIQARHLVPRVLGGLAVTWFVWYHLKYYPASWEHNTSWYVVKSRPQLLPGDEGWPHGNTKKDNEFHRQHFDERKVFGSNIKTSFNAPTHQRGEPDMRYILGLGSNSSASS